jgi:hypothetical protein
VFFEWLREQRPGLVARYERLYARGAYLSAADRRAIEQAAGVPWAGRARAERFKHLAVPPPEPAPPPPAPRPVQGALF